LARKIKFKTWSSSRFWSKKIWFIKLIVLNYKFILFISKGFWLYYKMYNLEFLVLFEKQKVGSIFTRSTNDLLVKQIQLNKKLFPVQLLDQVRHKTIKVLEWFWFMNIWSPDSIQSCVLIETSYPNWIQQ